MKVLKTKKDYNTAMSRLDQIFDAKPDTPDFDELEVLSFLIESYEEKYEEAFPNPDPVEVILFKLEQQGLGQKDLASVIGKNRASEILNRKKGMSISIIRSISNFLNISADILIQPYQLKA